METVVLVLCALGVFHSSLLGLYFLTAKSNHNSPLSLRVTLIFIFRRFDFFHFVPGKNNGVFLAHIKQKYQNLKLTGDDVTAFRSRIFAIVESKRPFLDNKFSLRKLSQMTAIRQHALSRTFNMDFKENFAHFINRIEETKRILREPSKEYLSITGITFECGFNSISSFNASFKKFMGITPSAFKKGPDEKDFVVEDI